MYSLAQPTDILELLNWRYATKKFDPDRTIPPDQWQILEQCLILTPSSFGLQPWKFYVIEDRDLRGQLVEHSWGQTQVVDASHLVVFAIKKTIDAAFVDRYIERIAEVRSQSVEQLQGFGNTIKGFLDGAMDLQGWATRQAYIALGQFMTCAAILGIDTCPMEGFVAAKYDERLDLGSDGYSSVVICPAGYRAADDDYATRAKVRFQSETVIGHLGT